MSTREPILLSWSTGKDSAWALHVLRQDPRFEVRGLLTTVNETHERVAMHGVRDELMRAQAESVGLPLHVVPLPHPCSNEIYEERMKRAVDQARNEGVTGFAFGDLYLEDIRSYREKQCEGAGMKTHFPLWQLDTRELAREMIEAGVRATLTCIDPKNFPRELAGATYDQALLDALPDSVDPCGENGEFHTFAWDGPAFSHPIDVVRGETVEREGFVFTDLIPRDST